MLWTLIIHRLAFQLSVCSSDANRKTRTKRPKHPVRFAILIENQVTFDATRWSTTEPFRTLATITVPGQQDSIIDISATVCTQKLKLVDKGRFPLLVNIVMDAGMMESIITRGIAMFLKQPYVFDSFAARLRLSLHPLYAFRTALSFERGPTSVTLSEVCLSRNQPLQTFTAGRWPTSALPFKVTSSAGVWILLEQYRRNLTLKSYNGRPFLATPSNMFRTLAV